MTIKDEMKLNFGVKIKYNLARRAQHHAIELIYGGYSSSFQQLPSYLHMLQQTNPGTITDLAVSIEGKFQHCFVALGATRIAFPFNLRSVVVLDGTHLKGKSKGVLFVAVAKDANEHVYPLAYGVGPIENDVSWKWFLERVRVAYGELVETLIVSDAHPSITNAVSEVFPNATHALCFYHLLNKMKRFGKVVAALYEKAAYAYRVNVFDRAMDRMNQENPKAYQKLIIVGIHNWARVHCHLPRYSYLTSNAAESWNAKLKWARTLPICSMFEAIRHVTEKWFNKRRRAAHGDDDVLTAKAAEKLTVPRDKSTRYKVSRCSISQFNVVDGPRHFVVDLDEKKCSCAEFQADGMPCSHAIAAITKSHGSIYDYVELFYKREAWSEAYKHPIMRVPNTEDWTVPFDVANILVLPPVRIRLPGRPQVHRFRSSTESRARTANLNEAASSSRAPKKCSICHHRGHTRRTCPEK